MTTATTGVLRVLAPRDLPQVQALLARDPVAHCFVASRVRSSGLDGWRLGGELWGWSEDGELGSLLYLGANLVPVETTPEARRAFADRCRRIGRRCSSIVGPGGRGRVDVGAAARLVGPGTRDPRAPAAHGHRGSQPRAPRTPACGSCARTRSTCCCPRASRCSPRRSASRRSSGERPRPTAPGSPSWCATARPTRASTRAASCSRPRSAPSATACARCRACGWRPSSAGWGSPPRAWRRSSSTRVATTRPS